jgi:hypothetical protein
VLMTTYWVATKNTYLHIYTKKFVYVNRMG